MADDTKSDVDKILDALDLMQTIQLATIGDEASFTKLDAMEKGKLPEGLRRWMEEHKKKKDDEKKAKEKTPEELEEERKKKEEEEAKKAKDKDKDKEPKDEEDEFGKPKKADFPDEVEYAKALIRWDTAKKAKKEPYYYYKKPKKEDFPTDEEFSKAEKAFNDFVDLVKKELETPLGDAIKKSFAPASTGAEVFTFKQIFEDSAGARSARELLRKEGLPYA